MANFCTIKLRHCFVRWWCGNIPTPPAPPLSTAPCPSPCHILGAQLCSPSGAAWPLAVLPSRRSQAPCEVWEQGHPAQPPKGRERNEWQQARVGSGDVRTWGKGSQTPCEKTAAQQCRGAAQQLCATHTMVWLHRSQQSPVLLPPHAMAPLPGCPHGWDMATATATLPHSPGALQGAGAAPCPPWLQDPGEALPGPASSQHHQEMSQGWCRSERGQEAKA